MSIYLNKSRPNIPVLSNHEHSLIFSYAFYKLILKKKEKKSLVINQKR